MNYKKQVEYILWGIKESAEDWEEEIITTAPATPEGKLKLEKAKVWAENQGFERLRISKDVFKVYDGREIL